ncbi:putative i-spanin [Citrobacter phage CVT22]|uniref:I-spanin n=1 Tax=Citrobacter phage CVT22 TaxID=1622234 RepID=A0A0R6CPU0_9CAUD|nr:putative i-spanin [Citrobacter phage CVT22]AJT60723.1 putative i-spanin [Citrobacter phage CVT22]
MPYKLLGASVLISIVLAVGMFILWQENASQARTIDSMQAQIGILDKQVKARESSAASLKKDKERAISERDMYKRKLNESEEGSECTNVPLNDHTKWLLDELYNSQPSK